MDYMKQTKVQLVKQLEEAIGKTKRQETSIARLTREKQNAEDARKKAEEDKKTVEGRYNKVHQELRALQRTPKDKDDPTVLKDLIKQKDITITKLTNKIQELVAVDNDILGALRGIINLGENNLKTILGMDTEEKKG